MPKVGKIEVRFRDDEKIQQFDLWYSQKEKFFIKGLPQQFLKLLDFCSFGYPTEEALKNDLRDAVKKYKELLKIERKVILYRIAATAELTSNKTGEGTYSGNKREISNKFSSMGFGVPNCSLGIEYVIAKEVDEGGKKYFPYREDGSLSYDMKIAKNVWGIIDWTPEREQFFQSIYGAMQELVIKLSSIFLEDDEKVAQLIDTSSGQKFLN